MACSDAGSPPGGWRAAMQVVGDALEARDSLAYRAAARGALAALPPGELNRPFALYHLARAEVWTGRMDEAVGILRQIRDERVESLMAWYVTVDSLFAPHRSDPALTQFVRSLEDVPVAMEPLAGAVHLLTGSGSNVLASIGPDGIFLVDTGYEPAAAAIRDAVGSAPVRYLVNTHVHEDHVGGNRVFGAEATVVAHANTAVALAQPQEFVPGAVIPGRSGAALPDIGIEAPWSVTFNDEAIEVIPLPAHTTGDVVVHFRGSQVVHLGDNFFPLSGRGMVFPGADLARFRATMDGLLERLDPNTRVVSGHDAVSTVAVLREQYEHTLAAIDLVADGITAGLSGDSIAVLGVAEGFPETWLHHFDRLLRGS